MKKTVIIICLLILIRPLVPLIRYAMDYEYISKVLCLNKQKPEMHCNGKCYLMKQLAKASDNEKPLSRDKKTNLWEFEFIWFHKTEPASWSLAFMTKTIRYPYHTIMHPIGGNPFVFRPPIF